MGSLRWIMHDLLREGDGLGKAVSEKAEEGSHFQWRERKTQVGVGVTNTSYWGCLNIHSHMGENLRIYC